MNIIKLTPENIENEHICCAISNNRDPQVASKKEWLRAGMKDGLVFLKNEARGKCFIEYIPAEHAWAPICADGYTYIDCFWVSGQFKGHGYANELLDACTKDSKEQGRSGLCVISSEKKRPFLSDPGYLAHRGFTVSDTEGPFTLMYLPFTAAAQPPKFNKNRKSVTEAGFVLYYTHACPFTAKYVPVLEACACENGIPLKTVLMTTAAEAQNAPSPWTTYALFYNGKFITNEILSDKKFLTIAQSTTLS